MAAGKAQQQRHYRYRTVVVKFPYVHIAYRYYFRHRDNITISDLSVSCVVVVEQLCIMYYIIDCYYYYQLLAISQHVIHQLLATYYQLYISYYYYHYLIELINYQLQLKLTLLSVLLQKLQQRQLQQQQFVYQLLARIH